MQIDVRLVPCPHRLHTYCVPVETFLVPKDARPVKVQVPDELGFWGIMLLCT